MTQRECFDVVSSSWIIYTTYQSLWTSELWVINKMVNQDTQKEFIVIHYFHTEEDFQIILSC